MYEQSNSENGGKQSKIPNWLIAEISANRTMISIIEKQQEERRRQNFAEYGNGKYTNVGTIDRVKTELVYDDTLYNSESDKASYRYGYLGKGGRVLGIILETGEFEMVVKNKEGKKEIITIKPENIDEYMSQMGEKDAMTEGFDYEKHIPKNVKENKSYNEAYNAALKRIKKVGR